MTMAASLMLAGCSGSKENPQARALLTEASEAYDVKDFNRATALLDSLQRTYPGEMGIQREGMMLRPKVIEQLAAIGIASIDSATIADNAAMERIKPLLKWVKTPGMIEGYWTDAKAYNPNFMNGTGIEARVSEIGQFLYRVVGQSAAQAHRHIGERSGRERHHTGCGLRR